MSEKKRVSGGQKKEGTSHSVTVDSKAYRKLEAIKNRYGNDGRMAYKEILNNLIIVCHDQNIHPSKFREYVEREKKKMENAPETELVIPENACPGLVVITAGDKKEYYNCVRGSEKGTVKIKKMTRYTPQAINICESCLWRVNLEKRWEDILARDKRGEITDHTYCQLGSKIDEAKNRIKCRANNSVWMEQEECFSIDEGIQCPHLKTLRARPVKKTGIKRRKKT